MGQGTEASGRARGVHEVVPEAMQLQQQQPGANWPADDGGDAVLGARARAATDVQRRHRLATVVCRQQATLHKATVVAAVAVAQDCGASTLGVAQSARRVARGVQCRHHAVAFFVCLRPRALMLHSLPTVSRAVRTRAARARRASGR